MSSQGGNPVDATIVGPVTGTMTSFADGEAVPAIEGYTLGRCIGRGGMGVVYEGHQLATDRRVAIKFLLDVAGNSESIRTRFEREVAVVVRLEHEGIVRVIDSGVKRGSYYYVMEYVEGQGLDDALPPGKADIKHTVAMIASVCDAVDYAHQRGVLHRDLKPGNVIVDAKTRPRLLDFGVAKTLDDPTTTASAREKYNITGQGQIVGTVAYMSPEQAAGDANMASMRSDVYSLGAMLYELLAGRLPIETVGSLRDILTAIAEKDPSPPSTYRKQIPKDLDAIVLKALEKKPALRYATAGEFAADLRRFLAHEPVTARRLSAAGRTWRWCVRNTALATTIAIATVTLTVTSTTLVKGLIRQRDIAVFKRAIAKAKTIGEALDNPAVMKVLLTANGLADQVPYPGLAKKVLLSDPNDPNALVNRMGSARWKSVVKAFDFAKAGIDALKDPGALDAVAPFVADSGEGRWTVDEAVRQGTPAPVIALALMSRFSSQGKADVANRLLSLMRKGFGGHAVKAK